MSAAENLENLIKNFCESKKSSVTTTAEMDERILDDAMIAYEKSKKTRSAVLQPKIGRIIMKNKITKLAAAAVIIIAALLSITVFDKSLPKASAAEVFAQAVEAMANLRSVYIKAQIRTEPKDNFELIGLNYDFVTNEIWKEFGTGDGRWRIEKPGRVVVMNGQSSL